MMDTAVVTGAGGFLGRHLCDRLKQDFRVIGVDLADVAPDPGVDWDIVEPGNGAVELVRHVRPSVVVHAAFTNRNPHDQPRSQYLAQLVAQNCDLFEAATETGARMILVSSSAVYGAAEGCNPIDESCPLRPVSLYGLAKLLQEQVAEYWSRAGCTVVIARLFNLVGPGQKPGMLLPDWVQQVAAAARGGERTLKVHHRATCRDFVDVRDAAEALALVAGECRRNDVFNVASGKAVSLLEVSDELIRICPVPLAIVETESGPTGSDVFRQCGSFQKLESECHWKPKIDWRRSLRDLWEEYMS